MEDMERRIFLIQCKKKKKKNTVIFIYFSKKKNRVNIRVGPFENRQLLTGLHRVADIYCNNCGTTLGWTYVCFFF